MNIKALKDTYEKYCRGDSLDDVEIKEMIKHTEGLAKSLAAFGDTARLVAYEVRRVHDDMVSFEKARKEKN